MTDRLQIVRILLSCLLLHANLASGTEDEFRELYDYYFPKDGRYINSDYRRSFDETLLGPPSKPQKERDSGFYFAFHGDPIAFHKFVHSPERGGEAHFGETWAYKCLLLLLKFGDERFSELLAKEDSATREAAGEA